MSGSKYTWSGMNAYFASYLHYNGNEWVKPNHTYLLMPIIDFINNCMLTIGVKLARKIGLRYILLISIGFAYLSCFLLINLYKGNIIFYYENYISKLLSCFICNGNIWSWKWIWMFSSY